MGLVVPGFIPTPLGEIFEYAPTFPELMISIGCWAVGLLVFTLLAKATIPIELGLVRADKTKQAVPPDKRAAAGGTPAYVPRMDASVK